MDDLLFLKDYGQNTARIAEILYTDDKRFDAVYSAICDLVSGSVGVNIELGRIALTFTEETIATDWSQINYHYVIERYADLVFSHYEVYPELPNEAALRRFAASAIESESPN